MVRITHLAIDRGTDAQMWCRSKVLKLVLITRLTDRPWYRCTNGVQIKGFKVGTDHPFDNRLWYRCTNGVQIKGFKVGTNYLFDGPTVVQMHKWGMYEI